MATSPETALHRFPPWPATDLMNSVFDSSLAGGCGRKCDGASITSEDIENILDWARGKAGQPEILAPGVILQDFTGVPAVVDLAAMRDAIVRMTGDPDAASLVNPSCLATW